MIDVTQTDFTTAVLEESHRRPVVVDFWAAWCGPCKVLGPVLERLATEAAGSWLLAKVDVDANPGLAQQFGVQGIPTVIAFRDGAPAGRFTGAVGETQVREFLDSIVPDELDLAAADASDAFDRGDLAVAEQGYRAVLASDPTHLDAGVGLATLLLDRDDIDGARDVLERLPRSEEVLRLEAVTRIWAGGRDLAAAEAAALAGGAGERLAWAKALAAGGDPERAMQLLVEIVGERGDQADEARTTLLDLFEVLGQNHPLVSQYRRRLASALF